MADVFRLDVSKKKPRSAKSGPAKVVYAPYVKGKDRIALEEAEQAKERARILIELEHAIRKAIVRCGFLATELHASTILELCRSKELTP